MKLLDALINGLESDIRSPNKKPTGEGINNDSESRKLTRDCEGIDDDS